MTGDRAQSGAVLNAAVAELDGLDAALHADGDNDAHSLGAWPDTIRPRDLFGAATSETSDTAGEG